MNPKSIILSLLNQNAEELYQKHTKPKQMMMIQCILILGVGLLIALFHPSSPVPTLILISAILYAIIAKLYPLCKPKLEEDIVTFQKWSYMRNKIMLHTDFEALASLLKRGDIQKENIPSHPKFKAIESHHNSLECDTHQTIALA